MRRLLVAVGAVLVATALVACSGGDPATNDASGVPATASSTSDGAPEFTPIETMATDPGPRPLLEWTAVDGADEYHVTVFSASGAAYWSWTGTETQVHVGGLADPDAAGAHVFEAMTWVVMAATADAEVV